jgi:hypothetical protein
MPGSTLVKIVGQARRSLERRPPATGLTPFAATPALEAIGTRAAQAKGSPPKIMLGIICKLLGTLPASRRKKQGQEAA